VPPLDRIAAFAVLAFAIIVVPGPSVMFVVGRAVAHGRRAALLTVLGNSAGEYAQVLLVAAGLGAVVERSVVAFNTVKFVGAAYLVWLGVQAIRRRRASGELIGQVAAAAPARRSLFLDGVVVGIANPKTTVFFAATLPQFVVSGHGPAAVQMALLGLVFVAIALVSDSSWGFAAGTARDWFARSPRRMEVLGATGGLVMIGLGLRLALTGRRD
jgi:threonine/homoserine/homoserine lactone efflux protein